MRAICFIQETKDSDLTQRQQQLICHRALRKLLWPCVWESSDARQRLAVRYPGRAALLRAVRKGLVDDVFVTRLSQLSRKRSRLRRILVRLQRKGVCVHTTEIDLRYDLYRHGLDSALL